MSDTTTPTNGEDESGLPHDWDKRLRWPPFYAVYRNGMELEAVASGAASMQHCPGFDPNEARENTPSRTREDCERIIRGARSQYSIHPAPWRSVEKHIIGMGLHSSVAWRREGWWQVLCRENPDHFAMVDQNDNTLISFYPNEDKGCRGIRTKTKPGRYLTSFAINLLSPKQILSMSEWFLTGRRASRWGASDVVLKITSGPEDFTRAYLFGPRSCMSGGILQIRTASGHKPKATENPVAMYAAGDLAIATFESEGGDKIWARTICWPDKKIFGRIYPNIRSYRDDGFASEADAEDCVNEISRRLRELGYTKDAASSQSQPFIGARMRLVPANEKRNEWLMPYVDGSYGLGLTKEKDGVPNPEGEGEWVARLTAAGTGLQCQNTNGTILFRLPDDPAAICRVCSHPILRDDDVYPVIMTEAGSKKHAKPWCFQCYLLRSFRCAGTGHNYDALLPHKVMYGGERISERHIRTHPGDYYKSDLSGILANRQTYSWIHLADGRIAISHEANNYAFRCAVTDGYYANDEAHPNWPNIWKGVTEERLQAWINRQRGK